MSRYLVTGALLLLLLACGTAAAPTPPPTATPQPAPTLSPRVLVEATATPLPTPTATPEPTANPTPTPTPTLTPTPTAVPATEAAHGESLEGNEPPSSEMASVFPEISEKMKTVRPVYTVYFHSEDWRAPGKNTTVDQVFKLLKMDNIATHDGYRKISPNLVVDLEPDLIIAESIGSVVKNPELSGLHMVTDTAHVPHHIFVMGDGYSFEIDDPGFRDTVEAFAAFAYPDTFTVKEESSEDVLAHPPQADAGGVEEAGQEESGHDHGDGHSHGH